MSQPKSIEQLQSDRQEMLSAIQNTTSADRRLIYQQTLKRIDNQLEALERSKGAYSVKKASAPLAEPKSVKAPKSDTTATKPYTIKQHESQAQETIGMSVGSGSPEVTIAWEDGYSYTGNEAAMKSRFCGCLADIIDYKCIQEGRPLKIWEKTQPHRAVGYYAALTHFWGRQPALSELGRVRPTEQMREIFNMIKERQA